MSFYFERQLVYLIKDISVFGKDRLCWLSFKACWVNLVRVSMCAIGQVSGSVLVIVDEIRVLVLACSSLTHGQSPLQSGDTSMAIPMS